jgi:hypothetical protein
VVSRSGMRRPLVGGRPRLKFFCFGTGLSFRLNEHRRDTPFVPTFLVRESPGLDYRFDLEEVLGGFFE